jgi:hypothetical protein
VRDPTKSTRASLGDVKMRRQALDLSYWGLLVRALVILLFPGCGDNEPPAVVKPNPDVEMSRQLVGNWRAEDRGATYWFNFFADGNFTWQFEAKDWVPYLLMTLPSQAFGSDQAKGSWRIENGDFLGTYEGTTSKSANAMMAIAIAVMGDISDEQRDPEKPLYRYRILEFTSSTLRWKDVSWEGGREQILHRIGTQ